MRAVRCEPAPRIVSLSALQQLDDAPVRRNGQARQITARQLDRTGLPELAVLLAIASDDLHDQCRRLQRGPYVNEVEQLLGSR